MFRYISGGGRYKVSCQNLIDKYSTERIASVGLASSKSRQYSKSCSNLLDKDWSEGQELGALKRSKSYSRITEEKSSYEQVLTLSQEIWTVLGIVFIPEEGKLSLHYKKYLHKYQRFLLTNRVSFIIFWQNFEGKYRHLEHLAVFPAGLQSEQTQSDPRLSARWQAGLWLYQPAQGSLPQQLHEVLQTDETLIKLFDQLRFSLLLPRTFLQTFLHWFCKHQFCQ